MPRPELHHSLPISLPVTSTITAHNFLQQFRPLDISLGAVYGMTFASTPKVVGLAEFRIDRPVSKRKAFLVFRMHFVGYVFADALRSHAGTSIRPEITSERLLA